MNKVTRIVIISLCAALALSSCSKKHHTPDQDSQKTPLSFTASSNGATVKADSDQDWLSNYHNDFGVWGIARHTDNTIAPYILWSENALTQVVKSTEEGSHSFVPTEPAFWVVGYTYNFIALAPYESGASGISFSRRSASNPGSKDALSFTYDMAPKYSGQTPDYDFDLMGAAAETPVTASRTEAQALTFWHLFTKLCVKVRFNNVTTGNVTGMRLVNVKTQTAYTVSLNTGATLDVTHSNPAQTPTTTITFDEGDFKDVTENSTAWEVATVHILPQDISDFELYMDFTIDGVQTNNFKINIDAAKTAPNSPQYGDNELYNWRVVISPKGIAFDVEVNDWIYSADDPDHNFEFPIE